MNVFDYFADDDIGKLYQILGQERDDFVHELVLFTLLYSAKRIHECLWYRFCAT